MAAILITYDLHVQGQNYSRITKELDAYPTHWRFQQSVWMIETDEEELDVANKLCACLDANDTLFVTKVSETSAWSGYPQEGTDWFSSVI